MLHEAEVKPLTNDVVQLECMRANPVSGKCSPVENALDYPHSSIGNYVCGIWHLLQ